jgi:hypothetical protein
MLAYQDMEYIEQVSCYSVSMSQSWGWAACLRRPAMDIIRHLLSYCLRLRLCCGLALQLEAQTSSVHTYQRTSCWGGRQCSTFEPGVACQCHV